MEILAKGRDIKTTKVKILRSQGLIPGVISSKKISKENAETLPIMLDAVAFGKIYKEAGESTIITVKIENGANREVLISEVQNDPVSLKPIHVSFYEVDLTEKITANIPIQIINDKDAMPVRTKTGIIITVLQEIEVECLPKDLPQHFDVDVSQMKEVGAVLTVRNAISVDQSKIRVLTDQEEVIAKVDYAEQMEVVEKEVSVEEVAVEEKGKKEDNKEQVEKSTA